VAAIDGRLVALACAIVRDDEWFLSGFWASADVRLQGIGGPLLREVWDEGVRRGACRQFVWASLDPAAIATYMKFGMLPGSQLFAFTGSPLGAARSRLETAALTADRASSVDRAIRGVPRLVDHEWWANKAGVVGRAVTKRGELAGYYYLDKGQVGPAAWLAPEDGPALLGHAMREAALSVDEVKIVVPGMNRVGLESALGSGLRLVRISHLLWTEPFGRMEQYIPSGPLLF
jgi:Acetyltransferase (GNAT) family